MSEKYYYKMQYGNKEPELKEITRAALSRMAQRGDKTVRVKTILCACSDSPDTCKTVYVAKTDTDPEIRAKIKDAIDLSKKVAREVPVYVDWVHLFYRYKGETRHLYFIDGKCKRRY